MVAAFAGQVEAVTFLVDEGYSPEERDHCLRTAIHYSTKLGTSWFTHTELVCSSPPEEC